MGNSLGSQLCSVLCLATKELFFITKWGGRRALGVFINSIAGNFHGGGKVLVLASKHLPEKTFKKKLLDWPTAAQANVGVAHKRTQGPAHCHQSPAQSWAPRGAGIKENGDPFLSWMETKMLPYLCLGLSDKPRVYFL